VDATVHEAALAEVFLKVVLRHAAYDDGEFSPGKRLEIALLRF
jgi:hypothetical protein